MLVRAQENRENPYSITDVNEMAEYVVEIITGFGEDSETGITALEELLDRLFDDAYENTEEWIQDQDDDCNEYDE